jgi:hypothetical protein
LSGWETRPSTLSPDGRYIVFAADLGAIVLDALSGVPLAGEIAGAPDPPPIGCCSVVWTEAGPLFASGRAFWPGDLARFGIDR